MDGKLIGHISVDSAEISITDAMYLLTDDDHAAGRDAQTVAKDYDGVVVETTNDGEFPVFVDSVDGQVVRIRIELGEG